MNTILKSKLLIVSVVSISRLCSFLYIDIESVFVLSVKRTLHPLSFFLVSNYLICYLHSFKCAIDIPQVANTSRLDHGLLNTITRPYMSHLRGWLEFIIIKQSCLSLCMTPFYTQGDQNFTILQLRNLQTH